MILHNSRKPPKSRERNKKYHIIIAIIKGDYSLKSIALL